MQRKTHTVVPHCHSSWPWMPKKFTVRLKLSAPFEIHCFTDPTQSLLIILTGDFNDRKYYGFTGFQNCSVSYSQVLHQVTWINSKTITEWLYVISFLVNKLNWLVNIFWYGSPEFMHRTKTCTIQPWLGSLIKKILSVLIWKFKKKGLS